MMYSKDDLKDISGAKILLEVDAGGKKVLDWAKEYRREIESLLQENGAVLIRGLNILSSKQFGTVLTELFGEELIQYTYRSTPRTELRGSVYTATEYHSDQTIPQHNENAYSNQWALRIGFLCTLPAPQGGQTPICDSRLVYNLLPEEIIEPFEAKKIMYVRNYSDIDIPWSEVFQTTEKSKVEAYCTDNNLEFSWGEDNSLRTRQVNNASEIHPVTGEKVWFNQAHLFHVSNLEQDIQDSLLSVVGEENLPRNTYYGDGSPIEAEFLQTIRDTYETNKIVFDWQKSDLMLLDNMLYTHGREPYEGARQVLVGMARPYGASDC